MTRAEPLRENGKIVGWLGTNTDITELERTKEKLQLVINELNHRVKNTLATIQSIANNTFQKAEPGLFEAFEQRLLSLSVVHDVLIDGNLARSSLQELVRRAVSTFDLNRFSIAGPEILVPARVAAALAMSVHELCTNATKYGSLSAAEGRVEISWKVEAIAAQHSLTLSWREFDGPSVAPPSKLGFGSRLIRRATASEAGATVDHRFAPDGVTCDIRMPLDEGFIR